MGEDKRSQLLAEIEEFSRSGPAVGKEPDKPELHRETLAFPDLNKQPAASANSTSSAGKATAATVSVPPPATAGSPQEMPAAGNSLLARLKQQAQSLQQDSTQREEAHKAREEQLSAALGAAFHYLDDLIKQLNIIKPAIPKDFIFPGNILFSGMTWVEGAADFRMVPSATDDRRYESLTTRFRITSGKSITVDREALTIEPLRKMLHDYGIAFTVDEKLNARNQAERARFTFPCEIKAGFLIKADYAAGNLLLRTRNIDRFGMMEFRLLPDELTHETLDELTKLLLGDKSRFMTLFRRSA